MAPIQVGQQAPDFTLPSTAGGTLTLSEALKEGPVVLASVRLAFTG